MTRSNYRFIHLVNLKDIPNWSVQYADEVDLGFTDKYPIARIGSFLVKSQNIIEVQDDVEYRQVTLKINNGGVIPRNGGNTVIGSKIGTKRQHLIHTGQFIMSKIDARNGAYGIVPEDLDGAIVSNDFPVFDVDADKIIPQFLVLVSTTDRFIEFARKCSSGTTNRKRIDVDAFLKQQIPLPSLEEQHRIVANYNQRIEQANLLDKKVADLKQTVFEYWDHQLYEPENNAPQNSNHLLSFANFRNISQWGLDFIGTNKKGKTRICLFHTLKISDICIIGSGGTPNRSISSYFNGSIPWIKTGELMDDIINDTEEKITTEALANSSAKMYHKGSVIIAMYGATIGKTAKLGIDASTNQACAVLHNINENIVLTDYVWFFLQTQVKKLKSQAYGGAQPNINASIIANTIIPIPDIKTQEIIVAHTNSLKQNIQQLLDQSKIERLEAKTLLNTIIYQ